MPTMPRLESTAQPGDEWDEDGSQEPEFKPLTREEAQQWRASQPEISVWRLVGMQLLVGLTAGLLGWLLTQRAPVAWSVLYGAAAVVFPSALMAYGLTSSFLSRLLAGVAQDLVIQLLNEAALFRQRDEVEGILEHPLFGDPASHHLQPGQATVLEPDHRLEIRHYAPLSQGSGQHLLR